MNESLVNHRSSSVLLSRLTAATFVGVMMLTTTGCASKAFDLLNPYGQSPEVELGERSNKALLENGGEAKQAERARHSLEVMGSYQRALPPQPYKPVWNAPIVRLMWIPDHLNKAGDLVPAHYYYLRVLDSTPAVTDAFEIDEILNSGTPGAGGATPWVIKEKR